MADLDLLLAGDPERLLTGVRDRLLPLLADPALRIADCDLLLAGLAEPDLALPAGDLDLLRTLPAGDLEALRPLPAGDLDPLLALLTEAGLPMGVAECLLPAGDPDLDR